MSHDHDHHEEPKRRQVTNPLDMLAFVLGGNATFTLKGRTSRFTYQVERKEDEDRMDGKRKRDPIYFVRVLTGSDNENDYQYMGQVKAPGLDRTLWTFEHGRKAKITAGTASVTAFAWFWEQLKAAQRLTPHKLGQVEFWHEGRCGRCGRTLTVPESVERGFGPECILLMAEAA